MVQYEAFSRDIPLFLPWLDPGVRLYTKSKREFVVGMTHAG